MQVSQINCLSAENNITNKVRSYELRELRSEPFVGRARSVSAV